MILRPCHATLVSPRMLNAAFARFHSRLFRAARMPVFAVASSVLSSSSIVYLMLTRTNYTEWSLVMKVTTRKMIYCNT
jgi:hypothetical protein